MAAELLLHALICEPLSKLSSPYNPLKLDLFRIEKVELGDLVLRSKVLPESKGIVSRTCNGQFTQSVFFGKAGVGKSTVASLVSSKPGLFDSGTTSTGTTTLGYGVFKQFKK